MGCGSSGDKAESPAPPPPEPRLLGAQQGVILDQGQQQGTKSLVIDVLCGRHFFVEKPCCFTRFTYKGKEFRTDTDDGATNPKWENGNCKFQVDYDGKPISITFEVMNRTTQEELRLASVIVQWDHLLPGLRQVEDFVVKAHYDGVKDTAAIRVAATVAPNAVQPKQPNHRALLVGCSYPNTGAHLPHCHEDASKIKTLLCDKWSFVDSPANLKVLMDGESNPAEEMPNKKNIIAAMNWLVQGAVSGDSLLFYYSGHGCQRPNRNRKEKDGFDEAIVPCDRDEPILDDEMNRILVQPLPEGVRLTVILDCCHSGSGMDLAYNWDPYTEDSKWELDPGGFYSEADVLCISGCKDDEVSLSVPSLHNQYSTHGPNLPTGALSAALCVALEVHETQCKMNWKEMFNIMKCVIRDFKWKQQVQFSSTQKFDLRREFNFHDCIPDSNKRKGPVTSDGETPPETSKRSGPNLLNDEKFVAGLPPDLQQMFMAGELKTAFVE